MISPAAPVALVVKEVMGGEAAEVGMGIPPAKISSIAVEAEEMERLAEMVAQEVKEGTEAMAAMAAFLLLLFQKMSRQGNLPI